MGIKYLISVLTCILLVANNAEHLFLCLQVICKSSLEQYLFLIGFFCFFNFEFYGFFMYFGYQLLIRYIVCKYPLPFSRPPFILFMAFFVVEKFFGLMQSYLTSIRMVVIKKTRNKCWQECGENGTLMHCWWECKLMHKFWKTV